MTVADHFIIIPQIKQIIKLIGQRNLVVVIAVLQPQPNPQPAGVLSQLDQTATHCL